MTKEAALTWSWLNVLTKKRADALTEVYGDLDAALTHVSPELLKSLGCREDTVHLVQNRFEELDPAAYAAALQKRGLTLLCIEENAYPHCLKEIGDPPVFLHCRGDLSILDQPCLALVGTRHMSPYGRRVVESFVPELVRAGVVTVSGLAQGIDAEVAKQTLAAGGRTVAVLGHGLGSIYPRSNAKLAEEIVEAGGLLLSEYPLDIAPDKYTFPARNRIIAGLSLGVAVLEAGEESGALITADFALDYNRDAFAVPGQIFDPQYCGCHELISRGHAKLVSSATEILREIGVITPAGEKRHAFAPRDALEEAIYRVLTTMPQPIDTLVERSRLDTGTTNATLTILELAGAAKNVGNGMWVRV